MKIVQGDLVKLAKGGHFDLIFHGCNCFCTMKSGVAKSISETFPKAREADLETIKGDRSKLGSYSSILSSNAVGGKVWILNAYTQYDYGRDDKDRFEYLAFSKFLKSLVKDILEPRPELSIGYPKIGSGLAGGDWEQIQDIIYHYLAGYDHTLVEYSEI